MRRLTILLALLGAPALAQGMVTTSDGQTWIVEVAGQSLMLYPSEGGPTDAVQLLPDCTAISDRLGTGTWAQSSHGFAIDIGGVNIASPEALPDPLGSCFAY